METDKAITLIKLSIELGGVGGNDTISSILDDALENTGYDGLCNTYVPCGCRIGDLIPCDSLDFNCVGGYETVCDCGEGCDSHISIEEPKETPDE